MFEKSVVLIFNLVVLIVLLNFCNDIFLMGLSNCSISISPIHYWGVWLRGCDGKEWDRENLMKMVFYA